SAFAPHRFPFRSGQGETGLESVLSAPVLLLVTILGATEPPPAAPERTRAARQALASGDYAGAAELARQAIETAPDFADAWLLLGLALFRGDHPAPARDAFARAAELDPSSAIIQFNLGSSCFESGLGADAETAYLAAAKLDSKLAPLALLRAGMAARLA